VAANHPIMASVNAANLLLVPFRYPAAAGIFDEMAKISAGCDRADPVHNLFDRIAQEIAAALPTALECGR
jgi:hypothetical protein